MLYTCHTSYSFRYGTLAPEELVQQAVELGLCQLVIADINMMGGVYEFVRECRKQGIRPLVGVDFRVDGQCSYVGIARNMMGFRELNEHLTLRLLKDRPNPGTDGLFNCFIIYPLEALPERALNENEFIGIRPHEVPRLLRSPWRFRQEKLVAWQSVTLRSREDHHLHMLLRAIDQNVVWSRLKQEHQARPDEHLVPLQAVQQHYKSYPQILRNTELLLEACDFPFDFDSNKNIQCFTGNRDRDRELLQQLTRQGIERRYGSISQEAQARMEKELHIINEKSFNGYFLVTWDIIRYAQHKGFAHVGRGSVANSLVSFALGITDVDPLELDLYFERFLNLERPSPPDFDIDFSWKERDEVLSYLFRRHGKERTVLLGSYNTFQGRSTIRELAKVYGLPKKEIDQLVALATRGATPDDRIGRKIIEYSQRLRHFPNHLSIHAGGVLISEKPIYCYTATEVPPKGFPVSQFDMYTAEDIRLDKLDILSQRGLGHIRSAVELIAQNRGQEQAKEAEERLQRVDLLKQDWRLNLALSAGDTIGCFYIESPAMRQLMTKLRCDSYPVLVAASSVIRPGVAKSGMMRTYIQNHLNPQQVRYIHPRFGEILQDTYGVMIYQEDVIKVAHHFGGISLTDADTLRRMMSGKKYKPENLERIRQEFFENCQQKGFSEKVVQEVWRQIESFSGYSFSKAHSASFAVESYQSLYLRQYFPLEFAVAVINNFGGFYKTEFYIHDARMLGGKVYAPCVNHSQYETVLYGHHIYLGFIHLKDLEEAIAKRVPAERKKGGPFRSLEDFLRRVPLAMEQLTLLIRIGAFRFTSKTKQALLWEADSILLNKAVKVGDGDLFQEPQQHFELPELEQWPQEEALDQMELLGFPLCDPFSLLEEEVSHTVTALRLRPHLGQVVEMVGYLVTTKPVRTKNGRMMLFGTFLDREGQLFDTTHFPLSVERYPFLGSGFYRLRGRIVEDFGVPSVEVDVMEKLPYGKIKQQSGRALQESKGAT